MFGMLTKSDDPFVCLYCVLCNYKVEIENLKKQVNSLSSDLAVLKGTQSDTTAKPSSNPTMTREKISQSAHHSVTKSTSERGQNIVVYGIEESPSKTPKVTRSKNDLEKLLPVLSSIDSSFVLY